MASYEDEEDDILGNEDEDLGEEDPGEEYGDDDADLLPDDEEDADGDDAFESASRKRKRAEARSGKKKRRAERSAFYDDMADEDDDDDEGGGYTERKDDELEKQREAIMQQQDRRRAREANQLQDHSVAEIAQRLKDRYASSQRIRHTVEEEGHAVMENEVAKQFLLPTPLDPKLFLVGVKRGQEKNIVVQLMSKAMAESRLGNDLGIESAMTTGSKELIFVEGRSEPKVKAALEGINNVYMRKIKLVPLNQMTEVLNVARKARKPLRNGRWIRMKRGIYKGDLAKVLEVLEGGAKALVQLVPRLDMSLIGLNAIEKRKKSSGRPPQRLFSAAEIQKDPRGRILLERRTLEGVRVFTMEERFDYFENNYYDSNGFLLKKVNVATQVDDEDIEPRIEELLQFNADKEEIEEEERDQKLFGVAVYTKGDRVRAISGDLENLVGTVSKIDPLSQLIYVKADNKDITMDVAFQPEQLAKLIQSGDHVKVIGGRYTGETGTVIDVDVLEGEMVARIVSDMSYGREMAVNVAQLKITPEVAQGLNRLQGYEVNDLVALGHNEVGIIIQVLREQVVVLDTTNGVREFRPEELRGKMNHMSQRRHALGADRVALRPGDQVQVQKGPEKRRSGTILHIYRNKLFIHDKHRTQNSGIFTAKAAECRLYGQSANRQKASINDILAQPSRRMQSKSQDMRGKSVKIKKGKLKGLLGIVVEETDQAVKVELHARHTKVKVDKKHVKVSGRGNAFSAVSVSNTHCSPAGCRR
eukprot:scaffold7060_cov280-Pinguiococcus_pyrenoidosus.AAC.8